MTGFEDWLVASKVAGLLIFLTTFIGIVAWIHRPGSGQAYRAAARIPLGEED